MRRSSRMSWVRRGCIAIAAAVALVVALPPGQRMPDGPNEFPLASLWELLTTKPGWASDRPATPQQARGGAVDGVHSVGSETTRANGGNGRAPGNVAGALTEYQSPGRQARAEWTTPSAKKGFDPVTSRRLQDGTSASVDLFQNADGSVTRKTFDRPVNFKLSDGTWQPIDTRLTRDRNGRLRMAANSVQVSFAGSRSTGWGGGAAATLDPAAPEVSSGELASVTFPSGQTFGYSVQGGQIRQPSIDGASAIYRDLLPAIDVQLTATHSGAKETLVLKNRGTTNTWVFPLRLEGLTPRMEPDGSVALLDLSGKPVGLIERGWMQDSKVQPDGEFTTSQAVTYELITVDGKAALKVTADRAWLDDPARVYPVRVDPSATLWDDLGDVYVDATSLQNVNSLAVGCYMASTTCNRRRSFLSFANFGSYAYGAPNQSLIGMHITSAKLNLYHTWSENCTQHRKIYAHRVTSWWSKTNMSPGYYPGASVDPAPIGEVFINDNYPACTNSGGNRSIGKWWQLNITNVSLFDDWSRNPSSNYGIALSSQDDNDRNGWKRFTSRDYDPSNGSYAPYLEFTWEYNKAPEVLGQYPPHGYASPTLTPELLTETQDLDNYPYGTTHQFLVFDPASATPSTAIADSGWISSRSWVVPQGKLQWAKSYAWTVLASDGKDVSTSQKMNVLTTAVPQAPITSGLSQNADKGFAPNVGNYTTSAVDAQVTTAGPALTIARSYNSRDPRAGSAFGSGWSSSLDARATEIIDPGAAQPRALVVTYPNGQDVAFGRNADGTFTPPPGRFSTLRKVTSPSAGYSLVDKEGTEYLFTAAPAGGRYGLTSVADAQGRKLALTYNASNRVTKLTSASGRALNIAWTADNKRVATVTTDPAVPGDATTASTWTYTYSGDTLTKVCSPTSATECHRYEYLSNSLYPTTVLDAGPHTYLRMNEAVGAQTATSVVVDNPDTATGVYNNVTLGQPGPLPPVAGRWTPPTAAGFNGNSSYVDFSQAKVAMKASTQSVSMWFKTTAVNQVLLSYNHDAITNPTTEWNYTPVLYVGTSGKLRGNFWHDGDVNFVTPNPVNDGQWHHVALVAAGSEQHLYLDAVRVGTIVAAIRTLDATSTDHQYVGAGFLGGTWPDQPNFGVDQPGYATFFDGTIGEFAFYDRPLSAEQVAAMVAAGKVASAPLTKVIRPSGGVDATVAYDVTSGVVTQITDANNSVWKVGTPQVQGSSSVYASAVLSAAPSDYFRLKENGVTQAINDVNGGVASYSNVTLGVSDGPLGETVAAFNGSTSYVALPAASRVSTGPSSVSLWFKTTGSGVLFGQQTAPLSDPAATGGWNPTLYVGTDGLLRGKFWNGNATPIASASAVNDGKWHHVALAASTTSQTMYLDGKAFGSIEGALAPNGYYPYLGVAKWSGWQGTSGAMGYFTGQIAEFAFFKSQLSVAQVETQYAARDKAKATGVPTKTVKVTDPGNKDTSYVYDLLAGGRQVQQIDARGGLTTYGYDAAGFLRTTTDPNGNMTVEEHDVRGNVIAKITCQDRSENKCSTVYSTYYPDATTRVLSPDPRNDLLLTTRDGRSASATDNTYLTTYTYDAKGNRTQVTDPLGRVTKTDYTDGLTGVPAGLPWRTTAPSGAVETVTHLASGDATETVDAVGLKTQFGYDSLGRVTSKKVVTEASTLETTFEYDKLGRVVKQTDPKVVNRVTGAEHTAVTTTVYHADGHTATQTIADTTGGDASRTATNTYNTLGQLISATDALGKTRSFTHDVYGNKVTETDPTGSQMAYAYDAAGQLVTTTLKGWTGDPNNPTPATDLVVESRAYDPAGRLASVTDAMGWITEHKYTDNGLTASVTRRNPSTGATFVIESTGYDAAGNPTSKVTGNGATTTNYTFDVASRNMTQTTDPAGVNRTTTFHYGPDDTLVTTKVAAGSDAQVIDYTYDPAGRKTSDTVSRWGTQGLVGWWRLNETVGSTAVDSWSGGQKGLATDVSWSGDAAMFNGTSSDVTITRPVIDTSRSFTVSAWVNLADKSANRRILTKGSSAYASLYLFYDQPADRWMVQMPPTTDSTAWNGVRSTSVPATGSWTHLTATFDSLTGTLKLYVNGVAEGIVTSIPSFNDPNGTMWLGRSAGGGYFSGSIGNVQMFARAVTPGEVTTLYGNGRTGVTLGSTGPTTVRELDKRGLPTRTTDANGNVTHFEHDAAGQLVVSTMPTVSTEENGGAPVVSVPSTAVGFNTFGEAVEQRDAKGRVTTIVRDAAGQVVETRLPSYTPPGSSTPINPVAKTVYDSSGQAIETEDPLGRKTFYVYDQLGRLAKTTAPDNGVTTFAYTLNGEQLSVTDPNGARSEATYDFLGRKVTTTTIERSPAAAHVTIYGYDSAGRLASVTPPGRASTTYKYNAAGETLEVKDGAGNATTFVYDFVGRKTETVAADSSKQTVVYNLAGLPLTQQSLNSAGAVLATTSATYDAKGQLLTTTDARGAVTSLTYDATGMVTQVAQPVSATDAINTSFGYDIAGKPTRYTDGRGNRFLTTYNAWGKVESQIEPGGATFSVGYDAAGQAVNQSAPGGVSVTNAYDAVGRLIGQTGAGADAPTANRTFGYDPAGRMTSVTEGSNTTNVSYTDRGLLASVSGAAGGSSFTWTPDGLMASRQDAAGTSSYGYDTAGRLSTVSDASTGEQGLLEYNNLSQLTKITYGSNGTRRAFTYDGLRRLETDSLSKPDGGTIASIVFGYDANGNETSKTMAGFAGASSNTYTYDLSNRLTSWNDGSATTSYEYDKSGNRTKIGSRVFTYDERNQLISDGNATYTYTLRGTMSGSTVGTVTTPSTFDAYSQQISQGSRTYTYDGLGRVLSASGGVSFAYSGTGNHLASDGTATYSRDPSGDLFGVKEGGTGVFAWTDLHDDVVAQFTSTATALSGSRTYNPFGTVTANAGIIGNLGYQSGWTDPSTSRVNMHARWYNPETAQFASRDTATVSPVPNSIRANRFAYGDGNPMTVTDPTGHFGSWLKSKATSAWNATKSAVSSAVSWVGDKVSSAYNYVANEVREMRDWARQKVQQVKDWGVQKLNNVKEKVKNTYNDVKQKAQDAYNKAKQAAQPYLEIAQKAAETYKQTLVDAYKATENWVKEHKAEIAGFVVGAVVGIGCGALIGWTGVGAVACGALAGAAGTLVTGLIKGKSGWDLVGDVALGAVSGAALGGLGSMLGSGISAVVGGGIKSVIGGGLKTAAGKFAAGFKAEAGNILGGFKGIGNNLLSRAGNGINSLTNGVKDLAKSPWLGTRRDWATPGGKAPHPHENGLPTRYSPTQTVIGSDKATLDNAATLVNEGMHDVIVHGGRDGMGIVDGAKVNPAQIAEMIMGNPGWQGQSCRLLICHAGSSGLGQELSNLLGVPVQAATKQVRALTGGGTEIKNGGVWNWLTPG